jgi:hydroxyacylglutathione hydrolase
MISPANTAFDRLEPQVVTLHTRNWFMQNYTYLVVDPATDQAVIVDPAWEIKKITGAVTDARATVRGILVTHSHFDHVRLARPLSAIYDCPIWMSTVEIADSGFRARRLVGIGAEAWTVGRMLIEPILTPGHTPGSTCYLIGSDLFTGDVLFAEGCGWCHDTPAAHAMFTSLEHLKTRLAPDTRVFSGHSYGAPPGQPMSRLRRSNIYLQFPTKESFAAYRLRRRQSWVKMLQFR